MNSPRTIPGVKQSASASPQQHANQIYTRRQLDKIATRWDARAAGWDQALLNPDCHLNEDEGYSRFLREAHRVIDGRRHSCAKGGVIDVGCGTGLVLVDVISHFAWGVGIDISKQMICRAHRKRIKNARFLIADCFKIAEFCPPAKMVLSRGILLSHYGRIQGERLLNSVRTGLRPQGIAILDFLNLHARARHQHSPDKTYFSGKEVRQMALAAGFRSAAILGELERRVLFLLAES